MFRAPKNSSLTGLGPWNHPCFVFLATIWQGPSNRRCSGLFIFGLWITLFKILTCWALESYFFVVFQLQPGGVYPTEDALCVFYFWALKSPFLNFNMLWALESHQLLFFSYNLAESIQRKMQGAHQADYVVREVTTTSNTYNNSFHTVVDIKTCLSFTLKKTF